MAHDDSDSDLEVISDSVSVNLRCPVSDGLFHQIALWPLNLICCF